MTLYVLADGALMHRVIPRGSAIVGTPAPDGRTVMIDCEYASRSPLTGLSVALALRFSTYAARVQQAARAHRSPYPTRVRAWLPWEDLIPVGAWNEAERRVVVTDGPRLMAWLDVTSLSVHDLYV